MHGINGVKNSVLVKQSVSITQNKWSVIECRDIACFVLFKIKKIKTLAFSLFAFKFCTYSQTAQNNRVRFTTSVTCWGTFLARYYF
jgi:hypothetical protein